MTSAELDALAARLAPLLAPLVARELAPFLRTLAPAQPQQTAGAGVLPRLTVEQFAFVIDRSQELVRRRIRGCVIPRADVSGPPYLIHPRALARFGVTPDIAAAKLVEWKLAN